MVNGLRCEISPGELREHLEIAAAKRTNQIVVCKAEIKRFNDAGITKQDSHELRGLEHTIQRHERKIAYFLFLAEHLANEPYSLSRQDLSEIDFEFQDEYEPF